jgi:predicted signal transduction protein with EAL and GGDEF domain
MRGLAVVSAVYLAASLAVPEGVRKTVAAAYFPVAALGLVWTTAAMIRAVRCGRSAAWQFLAADLIFGVVFGLDLARAVGYAENTGPLFSGGWFVVLLLCMSGMGRRIQDAYDETERASRRLARHNEELEAVAEQRTRELREANEVLRRMAETDGLTGIPNRRKFEAALGEELRRAARTGTTLSVGMFDVDFFKSYIDPYGHVEGDACR